MFSSACIHTSVSGTITNLQVDLYFFLLHICILVCACCTQNASSAHLDCWLYEPCTLMFKACGVKCMCVGASRAACATVHALNVDPTPVSRRTRHKVCHHPVTMAPNLAETRRRQGAPCHRGNTSGMLPPLQPAPEKYTERYMHTGPCEGLFGGQKIFCVKKYADIYACRCCPHEMPPWVTADVACI